MDKKSSPGVAYVMYLCALPLSVALGIDMYLPAYPSIAANLGADEKVISLTMSLFMLGLAVGHIAYGPWADKVGRKIPLTIGLCIAIVADITCASANTLPVFMVARFAEAFGSASAAVICLALIADKFPESKRDRYISLMFMANIFSPLLGPYIGGYLADGMLWRAIFVCLAIYHAVLLLITQIMVRHGDELEASGESFLSFFRTSFKILGDRKFVYLMGATTLIYLIPFEWVVFSPEIILHDFGVTAKDYAPYFYIPALGFTAGTIINLIIRRWYSSNISKILIPLAILAIASICGFLLIISHWGEENQPKLIVEMMTLCFLWVGIAQPLLTNLAISCHGELAGTASGMVCCLQCIMAAGAGLFAMFYYNGGLASLSSLMLATVLVSAVLYLLASTDKSV